MILLIMVICSMRWVRESGNFEVFYCFFMFLSYLLPHLSSTFFLLLLQPILHISSSNSSKFVPGFLLDSLPVPGFLASGCASLPKLLALVHRSILPLCLGEDSQSVQVPLGGGQELCHYRGCPALQGQLFSTLARSGCESGVLGFFSIDRFLVYNCRCCALALQIIQPILHL